MSKLSEEAIRAIVENIKDENRSYYGKLQEVGMIEDKEKPEELTYEEELLLKYSLPIAFFLYVLRALGYVLLAIFIIVIAAVIAIFWYVYIPHLINMFLFEKFPQFDNDYFNLNLLFLVFLWIAKDVALFFLYENLTSNLDRVNKIKAENKELFDD